MLLPGVDLGGGQEIAERLRAAVEQAHPAGVAITISLGVSAGRGEQVDYDTLFKAADTALYEAKRSGRNRSVSAPALPDPDMPSADGQATAQTESHPVSVPRPLAEHA